jgi:MFS family permease
MQLVAPDILAEAVREGGLSPLLSILGVVVGLMLWLLGWRAHRFWIVLITTVMAGVYGLYQAPEYRAQPLLAGILLAIAAGMLALALVRLVAFVAGGIAALLLMQALIPAWDEPLVFFLLGGLIGLVLFRIWTMALTSLAGTLFLAYSSLCLADKWGKLNAVLWAEKQTVLLNWICGGLTCLGLITQFYLERRRVQRQKKAEQEAQKKKDKEKEREREREREREARENAAPKSKLWALAEKLYRRAG